MLRRTLRNMGIGFFSTPVMYRHHNLEASRESSQERATNNSSEYNKNLSWMENRKKSIKPNPGYTKIDASGLDAAMEKAKPLEKQSPYCS